MAKLLVASVVNISFSKMPKTKAVTAILESQGFDYRPVVDELWFGWLSKLLGFIEIVNELRTQDDYTDLMFVDGADIVALDGPDEVMRRFYEFDHPWVYNAEPFIWSPNSFTPEQYPTPRCTYRYLNAGASIGEIGHIAKYFDKWTDNGKKTLPGLPGGDQDWMAAWFIEDYPDAIQLDHDCKLFQCMCGSLVGDNPHCTIVPGRVHNNLTGTDPIIIHFNGGDDITTLDRRILWDWQEK